MSSRFFNISFTNLTFEAQQEIIDEVKEALLINYQEECENGRYGKNFGRKEYKNMTWQEAFCREYSVDFHLWETEEEAKKFDWQYGVEQYAEEEAIRKCEASPLPKLEVEI
jgi:hypothetical protein